MTRSELKEIICKVIEKMREERKRAEHETPAPACIFQDHPCDVTTKYGINEEG
ncbi:MAG: hypothetical protein HY744_32045 [Deltaproteobacteria bacterium]|nr:hypothetical protein [Deltaproteobacteria bacterium]